MVSTSHPLQQVMELWVRSSIPCRLAQQWGNCELWLKPAAMKQNKPDL